MSTSLICTIDTEEEGLWGGKFRAHGNKVTNVQGITRFQALCDEFDIRPTYLVDTPIVDDDVAVDILAGIHDREGCEIGAHLHPWCAPPYVEERNEFNSFACNLPIDVQRKKLGGLTDLIEHRFGVRATSFRAGRYGWSGAGMQLLADLGFTVDSSVIPFMSYTESGGPDFRTAPFLPYFPDKMDITCASMSNTVLEVPVSVGFNWSNFTLAHRINQLAVLFPFRQMRFRGVLDRLGVLKRIKFSPEQSSSRLMNRLARIYVQLGAPCMVMLFHSTSLVAGLSPYVRNGAHLDSFYERLRNTFGYCVNQLGMTPKTLSEFARGFTQTKQRLAVLDH